MSLRTCSTALAIWLCLAAGAAAEIVRLNWEIAARYPHDPTASTQGLVYRDGFLYESTGGYGRSSLREVELETGRVRRIRKLAGAFFGEGLAELNGKLFQLTWKAQTGWIYDIDDFNSFRRFSYWGEGWGLTDDGRYLIQSDGSAELRVIDPENRRVLRTIRVTAAGKPVRRLNELEHVAGFVYANIWHSDRIARIDPKTGDVTAWLDLGRLRRQPGVRGATGVLNGIAYLPGKRLFIVTGKRWPRIFLIRIVSVTDRPVPATQP